MPTIYHNFHETAVSWIETATRKGTTALDLDTPLFSGLFVPELSPEEPAHATERVRSGGAPAISLFTASEMTAPRWQPVTSVVQA